MSQTIDLPGAPGWTVTEYSAMETRDDSHVVRDPSGAFRGSYRWRSGYREGAPSGWLYRSRAYPTEAAVWAAVIREGQPTESRSPGRVSIRTYSFEQRSPEWEEARRGMVTASMVGRLVSISPADATCTECPQCGALAGDPCISVARKEPTPIKVPHDRRALAASTLPPVYGPATGDTAKMLTALLVAERITGWSDPVFVTGAMMRGTLDEPVAREAYSKHFAPVTEVGFIVRDDWGFSIGYSPDGLVGDDGLIEIKSRLSRIQLTSILAGEVPAENMAQIQCGLLVTGRKWCDYVSFCGGMPLWRTRVYPDLEWHQAIVSAVAQFEETAAAMIADYSAAVEGLPATERSTYDLEMVI